MGRIELAIIKPRVPSTTPNAHAVRPASPRISDLVIRRAIAQISRFLRAELYSKKFDGFLHKCINSACQIDSKPPEGL